MLENPPKVSVCVVTYNHEKYIRDCLQSLVDQETDFEFEIIVADDCSTDATRTIIQEFADRYKGIIKPLYHPQNLGPFKNYLAVHQCARGEYIAHVDGDDYALPGKLQAQSDYLDQHDECVIVWHRMKVLEEKTPRFVDDLIEVNVLPRGGIRQNDLLAIGSVACHSSKMYRSSCKFAETVESQFLDFFIDAHQLNYGVGQYLPGIYGVYRANVGISTGSFKTRFILLDNLMVLAQRFPNGRRAISAHVLRLMLGDLYHRRPTLKRSFSGLVKVFNPMCLIDLVAARRYAKIFRSPV